MHDGKDDANHEQHETNPIETLNNNQGTSTRPIRRSDRRHSTNQVNDPRAESKPNQTNATFESGTLETSQEFITGSTLTFATEHSGPIPDPATLREYETLAPGTAARVIDGYLKEQQAYTANLHAYAHAIDRLTKAEARAVTAGTLIAVTIAAGVLIAGIFLVLTGYTLAGVIFAVVPVIMIYAARLVGSLTGKHPE